MKTLIVADQANSDSVVTIPPIRSVTIGLRVDKQTSQADSQDLANWISKEETLNGLNSPDPRPWHIVISYDQFDRDGDNVHSGIFEEYWASPTKYKRIYKSDDFNQTDFGTDKGLFREGDQGWPSGAASEVREAVIDPFFYAAALTGFSVRSVERTFSGYPLRCFLLEKGSLGASDPTQYCFEPGGSALRYNRGFGWYQTVYNQIVPFQGRNLARDVEVTDGGKPYLKLHVETIELIAQVDEAAFAPPSDAIPIGDRISGVNPTLIHSVALKLPDSLPPGNYTVTAEMLIGKDGRVVTVHAISGPPAACKACEDAIKQWIFRPYLVMGKPVEVEEKTECSFMSR
jgi:hypothetical protein